MSEKRVLLSRTVSLRIPKLNSIDSRLTIPTLVDEEVEDEFDWEGVAELFSRNFLLMFTELNFFGWDTFVTVVDAGPPFEAGGVATDGASLGADSCCAGALDSSPVVSPATSPASEDFVKSCLFVSIFAIYVSQDASYRVFKVQSLCSVSDVDRKKMGGERDCDREWVMIVLPASLCRGRLTGVVVKKNPSVEARLATR